MYRGLRDRHFGIAGEWGFNQCINQSCGLVWLEPMVAAKDIGQLYEQFYTHDQTRSHGANESLLTGFGRLLFRQVNSMAKSLTGTRRSSKALDLMFLDGRATGKLLEVGCGSGERLARLQRLGWQVEGQDIDSKAVVRAREQFGLTIHGGELFSLSLASGSYDAVVLNHVLEHVPDAIGLLAECRRLLKRGGRLVLTTPNINSYGHRCFGAAWLGLDPPRHLFLYNPSTLAQVAERAGLVARRVWTSTARAQSFAIGSLVLQRTGRFDLNCKSPVWAEWRALRFQWQASAAWHDDAGTGEECILEAEV